MTPLLADFGKSAIKIGSFGFLGELRAAAEIENVQINEHSIIVRRKRHRARPKSRFPGSRNTKTPRASHGIFTKLRLGEMNSFFMAKFLFSASFRAPARNYRRIGLNIGD